MSSDARRDNRGGGGGVAPIKAEYRIHREEVRAIPAFLSGSNSAPVAEPSNKRPPPISNDDDDEDKEEAANDDDDAEAAGANKKQKVDDAGWRKLSKDEKKARSGQNKARKFQKLRDEVGLCFQIAKGEHCEFGDDCKMSHDLEKYLKNKGKDIHFIKGPQELQDSVPFVVADRQAGDYQVKSEQSAEEPLDLTSIIDTTTSCPLFDIYGYCEHGWKCRFLGAHVRPLLETETPTSHSGEFSGWKLVTIPEKQVDLKDHKELNVVSGNDLKEIRLFPYTQTIPYLQIVDPAAIERLPGQARRNNESKKGKVPPTPKAAPLLAKDMDEEDMMNAESAPASVITAKKEEDEEEAMMNAEPVDTANSVKKQEEESELAKLTGAEEGKDDVPMRAEEKKRLDWRGKTYLAPLTTVGNLPFRRICVDFGADITCGEMAMSNSILQPAKQEWSLTRRHPSEKTFGIQLCGGKAGFMVPAAELVREYCYNREGTGLDFVDINLGCPIDLVFQKGAGSAMFEKPGQLGKMLVGMNKMLGEIPLTVKFRTGIKQDKNIAHKFVPRFAQEWGVSAMTLHGRSRQQRYSRIADWNYIKECATTLRESCRDAGLHPPPIFGNGDCFSAQSYYEEMDKAGVDGVMVARGALIKPWIFTEIQEKREWDISAVERLEGLRKYAEYGLTHWGTDTLGVNTTRRFLCEAMSFQHRYVPIGLLERMPPQMNDRPPAYRGRSELETLLASPDSRDWVKISEMFLGKSPADFNFVPKHKSNAYGSNDNEADSQG